MVMNIDIAPTLIDAAGFNNPAQMDGWSIHDITTGVKHRKQFMYEFYNKEECTPTLHAVRSFEYKYVFNSCDNVVEEFYDLINDSLETYNKINIPSYQPLIQLYRLKLDSMRKFYGDTILLDTVINCELYNGIETEGDEEQESGILYATVFPNPAHDLLNINWSYVYAPETEVTISDITGRMIFHRTFRPGEERSLSVNTGDWANGVYVIAIDAGNEQKRLKFIRD